MDHNTIKKCPTCGLVNGRSGFMAIYNDKLVELIRANRLEHRESCILCVEKHVGKAKVLLDEILTATGNQDRIDSRVKIELNYLEVIGNLQAATDEAQDYLDLWSFLLDSERAYRYEGIPPDWERIAELILEQKNIDKSPVNKGEPE